jgi:hypothetical protein
MHWASVKTLKSQPNMSFHKKALIAFITFFLIYTVVGYLQLYATEPYLDNDSDFVLHGVTKQLMPFFALLMTSVIATAVYVIRWAWLLAKWLYRRRTHIA